MSTNSPPPWTFQPWIDHTQILLNSFEHFLGCPLLTNRGIPEEDSEALFKAPFVVVSHGTQADPILNYGNQVAVDLWETDLATLLTMPSRKTAEPVHRSDRADMLARTARDGYIDDYQGIRITATGKRFRIDQAVVWNLINADGHPVGQAATFSDWVML